MEAPSSAALTVTILALPTRGQVLEKAVFRLIATVLGVAASIAIVGMFAQTEILLLGAFAAWLGICVVGLLDGNRAYAAALSGYTVGIIAVQQIDNPAHSLIPYRAIATGLRGHGSCFKTIASMESNCLKRALEELHAQRHEMLNMDFTCDLARCSCGRW